MTKLKKVLPAGPEAVALGPLLGRLRELIVQARTQALRAVDAIQVHTCWEIGRYIVEFEQQGQARARYGARLLPQLAERLTHEFGRGFDASNLRHMRTFYQSFPMWDAVRTELSWTHRLANTAQQDDQRVNREFAASIPPESVQPRPAQNRVRGTGWPRIL